MDLRRRLAELDRLTRKTDLPPRPRAEADLDQLLPALGLCRQDGFWQAEYVDPVPPPAAPLPDLDGFFTRAAEAAPAVGDLLFLDTETTGLAGGTGTLAFLVGASWWEAGALHTRQFFLAGPEQEDAALAALAELAAPFRVVVTYNGASFDLPLLRTRALLQRRRDPLAHLVGWDLLVPARRLWGRRLADCRQQTVETVICDLARGEGDIDGSAIPQVWFDLLHEGSTELLGRVLTHNRRDMAGMARIFGRLVDAAAAVGIAEATAVPWQDAWSLGRICERRQDHGAAAGWLVRAMAESRWPGEGGEAAPRLLVDAVRCTKRVGDWPLIESWLQRALAAGLDGPWLRREAAILYEHRLPDLESALAHARLSGDDHRVQRLLRRLQGTPPKE